MTTDELNIGRITGSIPTDVMYGGADLTTIAGFPNENPDN